MLVKLLQEPYWHICLWHDGALLQSSLQLRVHGLQYLEGLQLCKPGLQNAWHSPCAICSGPAECCSLAKDHLHTHPR